MILRMCVLLLFAGIPALADLSGRWSAGGAEVFVLHQNGNTVTGMIVSGLGAVRIGRALNSPEFALVRGDQRVRALRKRVGLPE